VAERPAASLVEHRRGRVRWLASGLLESAGVRHGFTTRAGGASRGAFAGLNFSSREGDLPERVRENWRRIESAAGLPPHSWALLSQVHGARVEVVAAGAAACHHRRGHAEADAMVTGRPGVVLGVLTADCLPVVIAVPGAGAVGIAHAGWRGTVQGVGAAAVRELCALAGASPRDLVAALGPAIGACCYQVGEEVRAAFRARWGARAVARVFTGRGPWSLDLQEANRLQLLGAGLRERSIESVPLCTACRRDLFYSYRRDGRRSGRMLTFCTTADGG
jgi:YfiH family protein